MANPVTDDGTDSPILQRQIVVLDITYDYTKDDDPSSWDWHSIADLGPDESAKAIAWGPIERIFP